PVGADRCVRAGLGAWASRRLAHPGQHRPGRRGRGDGAPALPLLTPGWGPRRGGRPDRGRVPGGRRRPVALAPVPPFAGVQGWDPEHVRVWVGLHRLSVPGPNEPVRSVRGEAAPRAVARWKG